MGGNTNRSRLLKTLAGIAVITGFTFCVPALAQTNRPASKVPLPATKPAAPSAASRPATGPSATRRIPLGPMIIPRAKSVDVKPLDPKTLNPEQTKLFNHLPKGELPDYPKVQGVLPELAAVLPTPDELQTLANNTVLTADFTQRLAPVRVLLQRMFIHPEQWNQRDFDVAVRVSQTFFKYSAVQSSHDHIVKMYARDYVGAAETVDELIARWNVMKELTAKYGTNEDPSFANPNNVVIDLRDAVQRFATKVPGEQEKKALYDELEKAGFPARTIRLLREDLYRR